MVSWRFGSGFQSTRSARSATSDDVISRIWEHEFQSTRSARSATVAVRRAVLTGAFQSTRSARSATAAFHLFFRLTAYFNPRAPRGARRLAGFAVFKQRPISIHALREERDTCRTFTKSRQSNFNPRAPRGARRRHFISSLFLSSISIHALREERDECIIRIHGLHLHFNPRAPRGARQQGDFSLSNRIDFNPRAPRGARPASCGILSCIPCKFQSTRSARSATPCHFQSHVANPDFNPRAPRGARLYAITSPRPPNFISIHALREERDQCPPR